MNRFILHPDATRPGVMANAIDAIKNLDDTHAWQVEIKRHVKRRSDRQNRYLWGVVYPTFTEALEGWDAQDVHEYLLGEFWGWEVIEGFGRRRMKPVRRSSKLNKLEFAQYVDFCIRKASEHGLIVPEPDWDYRKEAA